MELLNISQYIGKENGQPISAEIWNGVFSAIQTKLNLLIELQNNNTSEEPQTTPSALYVNGVLHTENTINLTPGQSYTLNGTVNGKIVIDASGGEAPAENTYLRFSGVTILSDDNTGIEYLTPAENTGYKGLVITLDKDSYNYVVCTKQEAVASDQPGAIYSMNNLMIRGVGYLACYNQGGHGLRGSEVRLAGPHFYFDTTHDSVHGHDIYAYYGKFYVKNANDIFGTAVDGSIQYNLIDVQTDPNGTVAGDVFDMPSSSAPNPHFAPQPSYYPTKIASTGKPLIDRTMVTQLVPVGESDTKDGTYNAITADGNGVYTVTKPYVKISGPVVGTIDIPATPAYQSTTGNYKCTVYLNDARLIGNIVFNPKSDNLQVVSVKDTVNVIKAADESGADCIKSENNIKVELKSGSFLYLDGNGQSDGIDGGDITITDSALTGVMIVSNCSGRGIKGNAIVIGPTATISSGVITSYVSDPTSQDYTTFDGTLIVTDNCKGTDLTYTYTDDQEQEQTITYSATEGAMDTTSEHTMKTTGFADIYARQGKKATKGALKITDAEMKGVVIAGSMAATISMDLDECPRVYYNRAITGAPATITNDCGLTAETYYAKPYNENGITISVSEPPL